MHTEIISGNRYIVELERNKRKARYALITLLALLGMILLIFVLSTVFVKEEDEGINLRSTLVNNNIQESDEELAQIAGERLIRMHIIANSDSVYDQEAKLCVRDAVISYLSDSLLRGVDSKSEARQLIDENMPEIERIAMDTLRKEGATYGAVGSREVRHFPGKVYGEFYLPAGEYEALCLTLGEGAGKNWWCIAFPALCLYGNNRTDNEADGMPLLSVTLGNETAGKMQTKYGKLSFRLRWAKWLGR